MSRTAIKTQKITEPDYRKALAAYALQTAQEDKLKSEIAAAIAKVNAKYAAATEAVTKAKAESTQTVKTYCEQNRPSLFGTALSMTVDGVKIGFRKGTYKIIAGEGISWEEVVARLKKKKMNDYLRTVEEIDKEKLIGAREDKKLISALPQLGITIGQEETFFIKL
jgi:phage host-nuclease inhibitor protein Gam